MLRTQDYLNLVNERGRQGNPLERVYRNLRRQHLFLAAYGKLYANAGAMMKGADPKGTIDGMSLERIDAIIRVLAGGRSAGNRAGASPSPRPTANAAR